MQSLTHQFLAFCRSKPADEAYNYLSNRSCPLAQCLLSLGYPVDWVGGYSWQDTSGNNHDLPSVIIDPQGDNRAVIQDVPRTFGALTTRLEAALAEQVPA